MKKLTVLLSCLVLLASCATSGYYAPRTKISYQQEDKLGDVYVEKLYIRPLFIGKTPHKEREELRNLLVKEAEKYGPDIQISEIKYHSDWNPLSLLIGFSMYGWVETAGAEAVIFRKDASIKTEVLTVHLGMSARDMYALKGSPSHINRTTTASGIDEQWVYQIDQIDQYNSIYYYFENGILTAIQD